MNQSRDEFFTGAALASDQNGGICEVSCLYDLPKNIPPDETFTDEVFPHDYVLRDGRLHCGETPGHGVSLDEKLAAKYPYNPKQLPVARLEDGTMWDW